jgi:hypothetical protein
MDPASSERSRFREALADGSSETIARQLLQWISLPSQRSRLVFCTAFSSSATTGDFNVTRNPNAFWGDYQAGLGHSQLSGIRHPTKSRHRPYIHDRACS